MYSHRLNTALMLGILAIIAAALATLTLAHPATPSEPTAQAQPVIEQVHITEPTDAEAFIADLFEGNTDVTPQQVTVLTELAQRYCTFVVKGQIVPGADVQTRAGWVATLTMPTASPTTGWSLDEANKFLDVAEATYCSPNAR